MRSAWATARLLDQLASVDDERLARTTVLCSNLQRDGKATKRPFLVFQGLHLEFAYGAGPSCRRPIG